MPDISSGRRIVFTGKQQVEIEGFPMKFSSGRNAL